MGKFNEYTQKATPADNDTMMIYDATSKANKLSPFSGIWNWMVNKLTNAVISNLQTNNKSVVGALNELSSNFHREWQNGNGNSIFDIFAPNGTYGLYSYYNIAGIPNHEATDVFVSIIKWNERMLIITETSIYITSSSLGVWKKEWREISSTLVS